MTAVEELSVVEVVALPMGRWRGVYGTYRGGEGTVEVGGLWCMSVVDGAGDSNGCVVSGSPPLELDDARSIVPCIRPDSSLSCSIAQQRDDGSEDTGARIASWNSDNI